MTNDNYKPNIAIHPGKTLLENMELLNMTQVDLACRAELTVKHINEIVKGKSPITPETAIKFERVLDIKAAFWNNLQKKYDETIAYLNAEKEIRIEYEFAKKYTCYSELVNLGYLPKANIIEDKAHNLLKFFGVNSLKLVDKCEPIAFRKSKNNQISVECLQAWLKCGEIEARSINTGSFDPNELKNSISKFRALTRDQDFPKKLQDLCAQLGIKLVYVPHFAKTYVNGATRWIGDNPLIQLTIRYRYADIFWFTFFHEIGHILKHGKKDEFIEFNFKEEKDDLEKEADKFASEILIPSKEYNGFLSKNNLSIKDIKLFADTIDIAPEIVAGRLAHDRMLPYSSIVQLRPQLIFNN